MKNLKFVDFCKGIMFLLIGIGIASFGIASICNNSAKADSPNTVNSTGKIMMSESGFLLNGTAMYHVLSGTLKQANQSYITIIGILPS